MRRHQASVITVVSVLLAASALMGLAASPALAHDHPTQVELDAPAVVFVKTFAQVNVQPGYGHLHLTVHDDGNGGADPTQGTGLIGLTDRIQALGGTVTIHSPIGEGTTLHVDLAVPPT